MEKPFLTARSARGAPCSPPTRFNRDAMNPPFAVAAHYTGGWDEARLERWATQLRQRLDAPTVTLGLVFLTPGFFPVAAEVLELLRLHARIPLLVGCSSRGLVVNGSELEDDTGLVLQLFHLPGAKARAVHVTQEHVESFEDSESWHQLSGLQPSDTKGWLVFADPYQLDGERWLTAWNKAYPGIPAVGGLSVGPAGEERTQLYLDGEVFEEGAVAVGLSGAVRLETVTSQGCTPIGVPWTITKSDRNYIQQIGNRPAYRVLVETFESMPREEQVLAQGNLFVGFAGNEYCEEFHRGDFLIRNLLGADPQNGVIAVGALPRPGQTVQFQRRDSVTATEDLVAVLERARIRLQGQRLLGGLLCLCNGRGRRLFGKPDHDAGLVQEQLGPLSMGGLFCNGELGPVAGRNYLHGYTASMGILIQE